MKFVFGEPGFWAARGAPYKFSSRGLLGGVKRASHTRKLSLINLSSYVRKDVDIRTLGDPNLSGIMKAAGLEKDAWVNLNPINTVREGYGAIKDWSKARSDAQSLDKKMDQVNDLRYRNGIEHRILGHTYRINNKKFDIKFPSNLDYSMMSPRQKDQLRQRIGGMADLVPEDRQSILAYFDQQSRMHPNMPLPKVRTVSEPVDSGYSRKRNTVELGLGSPRGVFGHEVGHHVSKHLGTAPPITEYNRKARSRLLNEQLAWNYSYPVNAALPQQYRAPDEQLKAIYIRSLGSHAISNQFNQNELINASNDMFKFHNQQKMLNGQPSLIPQQYHKDLENHIDNVFLNRADSSPYAPYPQAARVR